MEEYYEEQFPGATPGEPTEQIEGPEAQNHQTMGDLLDETRSPLSAHPKRGQIVDGVVVQIDQGAILVDIGAKLDGFIHPSEAEQLLRDPATAPQVGDHILVYVIQPENKDGHAVLSLSRAQAERDWRLAQQLHDKGEILDLEVMGYNKGGLIVRVGEVRGFIPATQLDHQIASNSRPEDRLKQLSKMVGQPIKLKIIELDRANNRLILSERLAMREWRERERERMLDELQEGEIRHGRVSGLSDFGAFVDIGGADGLVHLSELSWDQVTHPREILKVGDEVDVYVLGVDREHRRIALSLKRTKPEPWADIQQRYQVGQTVKGKVTKLASFGAFVRLDEGVEGLTHISELSTRHIQHPREVVKEGDELDFRIIRIDSARRRMRLSLKQLEEEAAAARVEAAEKMAGREAEEEVDVPTPEVLKGRKQRRRRPAASAPAEPPMEMEELSEWQEQLREYKNSLPTPAREPRSKKAAKAAAAEPPAPPIAVVKVEEEPKAVVAVSAEEPITDLPAD